MEKMDRVNGLYVERPIDSRRWFFLFFSMVVLIIFYDPLKTLFIQSLDDDVYDYIPLVPLVSAYFFYLKRKEIFSNKEYAFQAGLMAVSFGVVCYLIGMGREGRLNQSDFLSVMTLSGLMIWIGGFIFFYGLDAARKALFPLAFLFFVVRLPSFLMEKVISLLQEGSAEATSLLFQLSGVPVLREGFIFHLPKISIEVAKQCSGIHSGMALFITSLIAGKLFLVTGWRRGILALFVFPIAIMKNGLRIVTLSLLGNNLDERILSGSLHKQGGIPFFFLAVCLLLMVLWFLRRSEKVKDLIGSSQKTALLG